MKNSNSANPVNFAVEYTPPTKWRSTQLRIAIAHNRAVVLQQDFDFENSPSVLFLNSNYERGVNSDWRITGLDFHNIPFLPTALPTVVPLSAFGLNQKLKITTRFRDLSQLTTKPDYFVVKVFFFKILLCTIILQSF